MLWAMTWKNVWRNKARSVVIIAAIASGVWGGLLASAAFYGIAGQIVKSALENRFSHVQIHRDGFVEHMDAKVFLPHGAELLRKVQSTAGVKAATGRVVVEALAATAKSTLPVSLLGVDPEAERRVTGIHSLISQGSYLSEETREGVVVGQKLASRLGLRLRSKLVMTFQGGDGPLTGGAFKVAGIFKTESAPFDESTVFVRQEDLWPLLGVGENIHEVAVIARSAESSVPVFESLQKAFPRYSVQSWSELAPELKYVSAIGEQMMGAFIAVIFMALAFGIVNTMLMAVLERSREFGMLMAVGMHDRKIVQMVVVETIWIALIGGIAAIVAGAATLAWLGRTGVDLGHFAKGLSTFGVSEVIYPRVPIWLYPVLGVFVVLVAVVAAVYPARRALKLNPVELLRVE